MDQSLYSSKCHFLMIQALSLLQLSFAMKSREEKIIERTKNPKQKLTKYKLIPNLPLFSDQSLLAGEGGLFIAERRSFERVVCCHKIRDHNDLGLPRIAAGSPLDLGR